MLNKLNSHSPPTVQQVATSFRTIGWIGFWAQLGLAVVSSSVLLFAIADPNFNLKASNPRSEVGLFFAASGLLVLGLSIYWAFRYTRIAKQLQTPNPATHPHKAEVIHILRQGSILNSVGMLLTLLGVETIVGTLIGKSLSQVEGLAIYNASQLVEPLDILVVQANINTIFAQFVGIVISFWLVSRISHH